MILVVEMSKTSLKNIPQNKFLATKSNFLKIRKMPLLVSTSVKNATECQMVVLEALHAYIKLVDTVE